MSEEKEELVMDDELSDEPKDTVQCQVDESDTATEAGVEDVADVSTDVEDEIPELEEIDVQQMAQGGAGKVTASESADFSAALSKAEADVKAAEDKALRTLAEFENFKRRKEQEKIDFMKFANEKVILELLPILDSFELASAQIEDADEAVKQTVEGFLLIQKQLQQYLEKLDVTRVVATNLAFDPTQHQAVSQEAVDGMEANMVVREMQAGYLLNGRVIRPAMVVVST